MKISGITRKILFLMSYQLCNFVGSMGLIVIPN
jgi:hypothetical protein